MILTIIVIIIAAVFGYYVYLGYAGSDKRMNLDSLNDHTAESLSYGPIESFAMVKIPNYSSIRGLLWIIIFLICCGGIGALHNEWSSVKNGVEIIDYQMLILFVVGSFVIAHLLSNFISNIFFKNSTMYFCLTDDNKVALIPHKFFSRIFSPNCAEPLAKKAMLAEMTDISSIKSLNTESDFSYELTITKYINVVMTSDILFLRASDDSWKKALDDLMTSLDANVNVSGQQTNEIAKHNSDKNGDPNFLGHQKNIIPETNNDIIKPSLPNGYRCPKCKSENFGFDPYWNELSCSSCGWIYSTEKV